MANGALVTPLEVLPAGPGGEPGGGQRRCRHRDPVSQRLYELERGSAAFQKRHHDAARREVERRRSSTKPARYPRVGVRERRAADARDDQPQVARGAKRSASRRRAGNGGRPGSARSRGRRRRAQALSSPGRQGLDRRDVNHVRHEPQPDAGSSAARPSGRPERPSRPPRSGQQQPLETLELGAERSGFRRAGDGTLTRGCARCTPAGEAARPSSAAAATGPSATAGPRPPRRRRAGPGASGATSRARSRRARRRHAPGGMRAARNQRGRRPGAAAAGPA